MRERMREKMREKMRDKMRDKMEKKSLKSFVFNAVNQLFGFYTNCILIVLLLLYFGSGVYKIENNEMGVLTRFGKVINKNVPSGLHFAFPYPIDKIYKVAVRRMETLEINDFAINYWNNKGRGQDFYSATNIDPYCITGDNNIVAISLLIKYNITEPADYLFNLKDCKQFIHNAVVSILIRKLASFKVDDALTIGKEKLGFEIKNRLQQELDTIKSGVTLSFVEIKSITPPLDVQPFFDRVINAKVEKGKVLDKAIGYRNKKLPETRSKANQIIRKAESYRKDCILKAEGVSSGFLSRLEEYKKDSQINQTKIYLDFISDLYPQLKQVRVINGNKNYKKMKYVW